MPYVHDFILLNRYTDKEWKVGEYNNDSRAVRIPGELIDHIGYTLNWIPMFNPACKEPVMGLCTYGVTEIRQSSAGQAFIVFHSWAQMFSAGPTSLTLTPIPSSIEFERDTLVAKLESIAEKLRFIDSSDGNYYLLHLGV